MITQRWRERRGSFRRDLETIQPSRYEVEEIREDKIPRGFVERHHYSGTYPAARFRVGLYRSGALVGVAVFSQPCNNKVLTNVFHGLSTQAAVELGRFVLLDEVPHNGETWFLARAFELLRKHGIRGVVSFSDPVPRTDERGERVFPGHLGIIYQAHNGRFLGRSTPRLLKLLPDGTVFSARAQSKIRSGHRGWRYASEQLVSWGADPLHPDSARPERMAWLKRWMGRLTRDLRHPGNYRYAWPLSRGVSVPRGGVFPKWRAA